MTALPAALLAAALAQAASSTPPAAWIRGEWLEIHRDSNSTVWLDEGATRRDGDRVRIRIRALLEAAQHQGARYGLAEIEGDCRRRTSRGIAASEYDSNGAVTRQARGDEAGGLPPEEPWSAENPVSRTVEAACHRTEAGE